jgi:polar amino acid transport system substrate-binding protein
LRFGYFEDTGVVRLMKGHWCIALPLSLAVSLGVYADDVRLVTGDDYAPLTGQSLVGAGKLSAVVQAAFARSGMSTSLAWQPWKRGYLMTLRGEYDATFPYIRAAHRERDFLFSAPLYVSEQHLFSRAGEPFELGDLSIASDKRLCQPLGWQLPEPVQTLVDQGVLERHSPPGLNECAQLLLLGRDDVFLADLQLGRFALQSTEAPESDFHVSGSAVGRQTLHLIVPRSRADGNALIDQFDRGLQQLRTTGEYQRLLKASARMADQRREGARRPAGSIR